MPSLGPSRNAAARSRHDHRSCRRRGDRAYFEVHTPGGVIRADFDHIGSAYDIQARQGVKVFMHAADLQIAKQANFLLMACKVRQKEFVTKISSSRFSTWEHLAGGWWSRVISILTIIGKIDSGRSLMQKHGGSL